MLAFFAAGPVALAQEMPVELLGVRASPSERALADALAERLVGGALDDGRARRRAPTAAPDAIEAGWLSRAIEQAEERFAALAIEEARTSLERARARLHADARGVTRDEIVELALLDAQVALAEGDEPGADVALRRALGVFPELLVDLGRHPPTVAARVERLRAPPTDCLLRIEGAPAGARARLDGRDEVLAVPATVPCAEHWVLLEAEGHVPRTLFVELVPDAPALDGTLVLDPARALADLGAPFTEAPPLARAAARHLGAELSLLDVAVEDGALVVALGPLRTRAPLDATPVDIVALLRGSARAGTPGPDVPLIAGLSIAGAVLIAAIVTTAVVLSQPPADGFVIRGEFLP